MRAIAKRGVSGVLALAEKCLACFIGCKFQWGKFGTLVTAIAKGLIDGMAAGAKEVGFALFQLNSNRLLCRNIRFAHTGSLADDWIDTITNSDQGVKLSALTILC